MFTASASRVATRYLQSKVWANPAAMMQDYKDALSALHKTMAEERVRDPRPNKYIIQHKLNPVVVRGRDVAEWALQTRAIPAGKSKALELVARLFGMKRFPTDLVKWYDTNKDRLDFLATVGAWKERSVTEEGGLDVASAGAFKVHNTIGADEKKFEEIKGLVASATKALTTTLDFKKVLYGDVFVVGQLKQSNTLAWYSVREDDVYLRSLAKKGIDDLSSLVHELGHRYWFKFASQAQKDAITNLYFDLGRKRFEVKVERPKVGEPLPVPLSGNRNEKPIITKDTGLTFELSTGGYVKADQLLKILEQQALAKGVFPSAYSMKNNEEFFAECFAHYTLGKMKPDLSARFEAALKA